MGWAGLDRLPDTTKQAAAPTFAPVTAPPSAPPSPRAPSPSAPSPSAPAPSGGEISLGLEDLKQRSIAQAATQAYLNARLENDKDQTAINKAIAEANRVYQEKSITLQTQQLAEQQTARLASGAQNIAGLMTQRAQAFNQGMSDFERTGVATSGRIAGLNALRAAPSSSWYATMLGLDQNDPRVGQIAQAAQLMTSQTPRTVAPQAMTQQGQGGGMPGFAGSGLAQLLGTYA